MLNILTSENRTIISKVDKEEFTNGREGARAQDRKTLPFLSRLTKDNNFWDKIAKKNFIYNFKYAIPKTTLKNVPIVMWNSQKFFHLYKPMILHHWCGW